jgi:Flp pilus assembly pilin Flp
MAGLLFILRRLGPLRTFSEERGSTLAEYALIIAIVSIAAVALLQSIGTSVIDLLDDITFG